VSGVFVCKCQTVFFVNQVEPRAAFLKNLPLINQRVFFKKNLVYKKNSLGDLIQKPLGTHGKRKAATPQRGKIKMKVILKQKHRNLRHPQGWTAWPGRNGRR
jgi:hypothetical protein